MSVQHPSTDEMREALVALAKVADEVRCSLHASNVSHYFDEDQRRECRDILVDALSDPFVVRFYRPRGT